MALAGSVVRVVEQWGALMTVPEFLSAYYRAHAMHIGMPSDVAASFRAAMDDDPALADAARAELDRIAALGLSEAELKGRSFHDWVSRDGLTKALA